MTIFPTAAGPLLCLSPQDLPAGQPLTDDTLLPLVRRALMNGKKLTEISHFVQIYLSFFPT